MQNFTRCWIVGSTEHGVTMTDRIVIGANGRKYITQEPVPHQGKENMSTPITPQQMIEYMVNVLDNAVKDYPEEEQEVAKATLLDAFSAAMFRGPMEKNT